MRGVFKYLFLLLVLLSVLFNISGKGNQIYVSSIAIHEATDYDDYQFSSKDICPVDIFNHETNTVIPSNNYRLTTNNNIIVCENANQIGVKLPKVYQDVITFDIDNLAALGRNQIFILRKLRI